MGSHDPLRTLAQGVICPLSGGSVFCSLNAPSNCAPLVLRRHMWLVQSMAEPMLEFGQVCLSVSLPVLSASVHWCTLRSENEGDSEIWWKSHPTKTIRVDNGAVRGYIKEVFIDKSKVCLIQRRSATVLGIVTSCGWEGRRCPQGSSWSEMNLVSHVTLQCCFKRNYLETFSWKGPPQRVILLIS